MGLISVPRHDNFASRISEDKQNLKDLPHDLFDLHLQEDCTESLKLNPQVRNFSLPALVD